MKPRVHAPWHMLLALLAVMLMVAWWFMTDRPTPSEGVLKPLPKWQVGKDAPADPLSPVETSPDTHVEAWSERDTTVGTNLLPSLRVYKSCKWTMIAGPGRAVFSPPDRIQTTVTFDQPGDYLLRLTATDGAETVSRDVSARVQQAPFDAWKVKKFGTASKSLATGDYSDPDGDGIANLMEYALMMDPKKADVAGLPDPVVRNGTVSVTYKRPASAVDVRYQAEWTDDLITWQATEITEQIIMTVGDMQIVRASAPTPKDQPGRFLRLRVKGP